MNQLPLLRAADADAAFAHRRGETITVGRFLSDVATLSERLPEHARIANLCQDRYRFAVGFAAAMCRGQLTLLPPSEVLGQLAAVLSPDDDVYCLTDSVHPVPVAEFRFPQDLPSDSTGEIPLIPADRDVAVLYTSGSTGMPHPHRRSWGLLVSSARSAGSALGADALAGASLIGTVPHQHSYGLESLVMLAFQHGLVLHAERPFYPADIRALLAQAARPRILVTTPVHLRVLMAEAEPVPTVDLVLSATAPLSTDLAAEAELRFQAPLHEIYGCSEAGQLAHRRPCETDEWRCLDGIALRQDGSGTNATGAGIPNTRLADIIELTDATRFRLLGRLSDHVNIAGKRSSITYLDAQLASIEGVLDGAFAMPQDPSGRLVAFVVAPGLTAEAILAALRGKIDPAFLPRRLHLRDSLPRNTLGKLTQASVMRMLEETGS